MNTHEEQLKRLIRWNRFWFGLWITTICCASLFYWGNSIVSDMERLRMRVLADETLRFSSASDGPFVITHLVSYSDESGVRSSAVLPRPVIFYDSGGTQISRAEIERLSWRDSYGQQVNAPYSFAIRAIYYKAQTLNRESDE